MTGWQRGALATATELRCLAEEGRMAISSAIASDSDVRAFIDEYFKAW